MHAKDLSILIPARNEMFLAKTIEDILSNIEADTEIITVLDGQWADPPIPQHERVNVIFVPQSVGQRAATNLACKLSKAKYVMKCDAHCAFDKGFDRKMLEAFKQTGDNVTMVPVMRNLWAFDWKCLKCGKKTYQGPTPTKCQETNYKNSGKPCPSTKFERKMVWIGKTNPQSTSYCFDSTPHFQYFEDWKHRPQYENDKKEKALTETMSLQGSCWMLTREKYWELNISDEAFGSWGSQGIEVACKTWLSGGQVLVNHKTWYAHMFRTQGKDFGFPYPISVEDQEKAKSFAKNLFFGNNWDKQLHPLSWLIEKFWPVKGWTEEDLKNLKSNNFEFKPSTLTSPNTAEIEPPSYPPPSPSSFSSLPLEQLTPEREANSTNQKPSRGRPRKNFKGLSIIGDDYLGQSIQALFPEAYLYNLKDGNKQKANQAKITFICVPTTSIGEGLLDISLVEETVAWCQSPLIVIRSTVNPGTADYLSQKYQKRILVQPEFLEDTLIIGGHPEDRHELINLYSTIYNGNQKIRQLTALEAEVIKLTQNRAIAFKLAEAQELFDLCQKANLDYYTIRDTIFGDDPRFTLYFTLIDPEKKGLNPQYLNAWCAWAESFNYNPEITKSLLEKNKQWSQTLPESGVS